ncbi:hypothetical protein [Natranaerobius thermophilus]|uniref:RiboL-PSP-HEPN domain-containing protein n=1 Tax=Natranaerobius thermophilus (strain ATCC BAA-1301 / DSM 18059 / JW/NM-WN-LF) TaxID=457570 RepID=B2A4I8_NATTJ|nr:hypothetical protein Nther_1590 [Natranaerobius thermophilus JW/NM-WN-LF]
MYPSLKSKNILYGDKKKIKNVEITNTVFQKCEQIKMVINLRNEIIHNCLWEPFQKIYYNISNCEIIERFLLQPDLTEGTLDSYKNRKRFFYEEKKINEELPNLYLYLLTKILNTINNLNDLYQTS